MLSYQEALSDIDKHTRPLGKISVSLSEALDCVLADSIKAKLSFPHFDNAAVDGYAIRFASSLRGARPSFVIPAKAGIHGSPLKACGDDTLCQIASLPSGARNDALRFRFQGEIPAGHTQRLFLKPGEAMAIFTGAPTPDGTQAVVMQEYAQRQNGSVLIQETVEPFENVRFCGEDFKKGDSLISKGTCLDPPHLALLAAIGYSKVKIIRSPRVAVLITGNEIVGPGKKLQRGQIYDSNTTLLEALIKKANACPVLLSKVDDNLNGIRRAIRKGLRQDVLIVCGGVSVGKYDFVKDALRQEGVREIFWKINMKPGKPVFFGKRGKTLVFGLPGNPVSVYVTFEELVKPALLKMMGKKNESRWIEGKMQGEYRNGGRLHFIRVHCRKKKKGYGIIALKGQGSHQIGTLAKADGILKVNANGVLRRGQSVRVKMMSGEAIE